ncbi:Fc.00g011110.m01.CDS01 [Cosmosporella sp. VM-42]
MTSIQEGALGWNEPKIKAYGSKTELFATANSGDGDSVVQSESKPGSNESISDASIIFTGPRGNGKSSLAIIAGLLLRRRVIDADAHFVTTTGLSKAALKRKYGAEKYRNRQVESVQALLARLEKDCIVACGPWVAAEQCRSFMTEYSRTHPVIYVNRSVDDIEDYLGLEEKGQMKLWMRFIRVVYRRISNLEFFNLPGRWKDENQQCAAQEQLQSVLPHRLMSQKRVRALQKTQTALARFLAATLGHDASSLTHTIFTTLHPSLPEQRIYSNTLSIPVASLASDDVDVGQISAEADAVEPVLDARDPQCKVILASGTVGRFVAEIRRFLTMPVIYHVHMTDVKMDNWTLYFDLLYQGLRFAPEYLTINLNAPDAEVRHLAFRRGCDTILGHYDGVAAGTGFWQSSEPLQLYRRALNLGCGMVRLVKPCDTMAENFSCMTFIDKINTIFGNVPIIAYNTGDIGRLSLVCNSTLTPVLHPSSHQKKTDPNTCNPTNMTISERWSALFALHALDALQFFVVGSSIKKSLSPAMHNSAFQRLVCLMSTAYVRLTR